MGSWGLLSCFIPFLVTCVSYSLTAGLEAGGTSCKVCICVGDVEATNVIEECVFPTSSPDETLNKCISWLRSKYPDYPFTAIGIAAFGPLDLDPASTTYGYITTTPKPGWQNTAVRPRFVDAFQEVSPDNININTDVNAAAYCELVYGLHKASRSVAYITVGTGVGVGIAVNGAPLFGLSHPEMGHIKVSPFEGDESFKGTCPFHGRCVEGLVSSGAIAARTQVERTELERISDDDTVWPIVGDYLGQLCATLVLTICPEVIVFGGGIVRRRGMIERAGRRMVHHLNGYLQLDRIVATPHEYVVRSRFGDRSGACGAIALGRMSPIDCGSFTTKLNRK